MRTCADDSPGPDVTLPVDPTDAQIVAYRLVCEVFELPHQLVAAHEAELAMRDGAFDDCLFSFVDEDGGPLFSFDVGGED